MKEDILDQRNNLDESYWMHLTESISKRVDTWTLRSGGLAGYYIDKTFINSYFLILIIIYLIKNILLRLLLK